LELPKVSPYHILSYGTPVFLLPLESCLKFILNEHITSFLGPTLAAAGLSFLVPLTEPKVLSVEGSVLTTSKNDFVLVGCAWIAIVFSFLAWAISCYLSLKQPNASVAPHIPYHLLLGGLVYVISLVMTFLKRSIA
jgi:hypothetical protein